MLQSKLFARIKKQAPKGTETTSHKYLTRGDFIDQTAAGIYTFLPLGWRVYRKIKDIIREEMNILGGQELFMPTLVPQNLWKETNRWETIDPPLFKLKDRHKKEFGLGSTHEEVITDLVRKRVESYQDLPLYLYQIQNKFRNEMRATGGLLRVREFIMKDFYSFHAFEEDARGFYEKMRQAYLRVYERCGLKTVSVEADSGTIGGSLSHEFVLLVETGEDKIIVCSKCDYGANMEKAGDISKCPHCNQSVEKRNGIEVGHTFFLGAKYSQTMGANFINQKGKKEPIIMGCYGIGLGRLMAAVVEAFHDDKGIVWPEQIAPFQIHLLGLGINSKIKEVSEKIYKDLLSDKEILYDDRDDKSAGEKFAEADLIGIPIRLVVSEKTIAKNSVEIKKRNSEKKELIELKDIKDKIQDTRKQETNKF